MPGIERADPANPPEGPYQRLLREAQENYPDPVTATLTPQQRRDFQKRADAAGYVLDVSYRRGTLTIWYIAQRKGTR